MEEEVDPDSGSKFSVAPGSAFPCPGETKSDNFKSVSQRNSSFPEPGYFNLEGTCREFWVCREVLLYWNKKTLHDNCKQQVSEGLVAAYRPFRCPNRYLFDPLTRLCQVSFCTSFFAAFHPQLSEGVKSRMQGKPLLLAEHQVGDHSQGRPVGRLLLFPAHPNQLHRDQTSFQHLPLQPDFPSSCPLLSSSTLLNSTKYLPMALQLKVLVCPWKIAMENSNGK